MQKSEGVSVTLVALRKLPGGWRQLRRARPGAVRQVELALVLACSGIMMARRRMLCPHMATSALFPQELFHAVFFQYHHLRDERPSSP